jgi:hypothetical protein
MSSGSPDTAPDALQSCEQVAELYDITVNHVRLVARWRRLGCQTASGELMFSPAEVAALRPRGLGRPWAERFTTDNATRGGRLVGHPDSEELADDLRSERG